MATINTGSSPLRPSALPDSKYQRDVLGWATEAIREGEAYLKSQEGYDKIATTMDAINGSGQTPLSKALSKTQANHIGRIALSLTSGLTDIKPFWRWETQNKRYEPIARIHNKLAEQWWKSRFVDQRHADCVRWAVASGTGYLSPFWDNIISDLNARAEDPRDVLPIRPADNISIQHGLGVIVRRSRPVNYVKRNYPEAAKYIKEDRVAPVTGSRTLADRVQEAINRGLSPFHSQLQSDAPKSKLNIPTVDLFHCYLHDGATNTSSVPIRMGNEAENWSYVVPPKGLKYPRGRLIVFTRTVVLYDGPNPYWHGLFPLAKLTLDPWPWTWLGKSPLWDAIPLQESLDRLLRVFDDHAARAAEPSLIADKNSMARSSWNKLSTRRPGLKVLQNMLAGKGAQIIFEQPLAADLYTHRDWITETMEKITGSKDLSSLMQLGQVPSADTVDKIVQSMSPANRMRSRILEAFITEFAQMTLSNLMQFYTPAMRMAVLGPQGITPEDYDFAQGNPVPDYVHATDFNATGDVTPSAMTRGPRPVADRAQEYLRQFSFLVAPGSLLNAAAIERRLTYLMLSRMGMIDRWTLFEELGIPNGGSPPEGADTIPERLAAETEMGLQPMISPVGRKASGQSTPRLVSKES